MIEYEAAPPHGGREAQPSPYGLARWFMEGARTAGFRPPRWQGLHATPAMVAAMIVSGLLLNLLLQRLYIAGPADFYWQAIASGWFGTAVLAWVCYLMRPQSRDAQAAGTAPGAAHLFLMVLAQSQVVVLASSLLMIVLARNGMYQYLGPWGLWALWLAPAIWEILAQLVLFWRSGDRRPLPMFAAGLILTGAAALFYATEQVNFWYAAEPAESASSTKRFKLTQEVMEAQPQLLAQQLQEIKPQRPGRIDMYGIGFAPYAAENVFRRESELVASVIAQRFDAQGRILQLVNHAETAEQLPWATRLNLRRAIRRLAEVMDREEDILFLHLTSHGARNGELAAGFWPMTVDAVTPADLKAWLDEAGIRNRVISISACFSGSWIPALVDENTLVMTASDAEHTSYGCGRKSELTFFGRAMYDEQLRNETLSFEDAHAAARRIIKQREEEAGKDDGYSNPQIRMGSAIRDRLALLQAERGERD